MRRTDKQRGDWKEWRRRRAWDLSPQGWSQNKIAEALGVTGGAVSQWMKVGRGACGKRGYAGKSPLGHQRVSQKSSWSSFPACLCRERRRMAQAGEVWTTERVAVLINKQFGVSYHPAHVSRLLKVIKYSVQQPIERATQRDEKAITTWKEGRWPELKKAQQEGRTIIFVEEAGCISCPCWCEPTHQLD